MERAKNTEVLGEALEEKGNRRELVMTIFSILLYGGAFREKQASFGSYQVITTIH